MNRLLRTWRKEIVLSIAMVIVGLTVQMAPAAEYSFSWQSNPPPITGYRLYYKKEGIAGPPFYGTDAAQGSSPLEVGNNSRFIISGLDDNATYHFALTALYGDQESGFSQTITVRPKVNRDPKVLMVVQVIQRLLVLKQE